jgi:hexosaminidase
VQLNAPRLVPVPASIEVTGEGCVIDAGRVDAHLHDHPDLGPEGYTLTIDADGVVLEASTPEGLFRGRQTFLQLAPAGSSAPVEVPGVRIVDHPRFAWRGLMLDVARRFRPVEDVRRVIDLAAQYKLNVLHLHLTDDQGWRLAIDRWPRLAEHGGASEVGGGPGGAYSHDDYAAIVEHARARHMTVVPEIDTPGHTNAALAAYAELNCDGEARPVFTGVDVGFSSLCVEDPRTYEFLDDVVAEVAALTPGPFVHIGGDETPTLSRAQYATFVERVQRIVVAHGKRPIGWQEIASASLADGAVVQYWDVRTGPELVRRAAGRGAGVVLSPADRVYLDMKYGPDTALGLEWAGHVEVRDAYDWDPARLIDGVGEADVLGVEAALWTETIADLSDLEYMVLPRLPAVAEVAWSPAASHDWDDFRRRLAGQAPRWEAMGATWYRSPQVPWADGG